MSERGQDIYTPAQIAARTNTGEDKVRDVVRQEVADRIPDDQRMYPGGRVDKNVMFFFAGIYDAVASGRAISHVAPPVSFLRSRATDERVAS